MAYKQTKQSHWIGLALLASTLASPLAALASVPSEYNESVGFYTITQIANGRPAEVYYPLPSSSAPNENIASLVFLQGANVALSNYSQFLSLVAKSGFIVFAPTNVLNFSGIQLDNYPEVALVEEGFRQLLVESENPDSPLYKKVDPSQFGIIGHSFGGVTALMAIDPVTFHFPPFFHRPYQRPKELKAAVLISTSTNIGPLNLNLHNIGIPIEMVAGDHDGKANIHGVTQTYNGLAQPKVLVTIKGANHFSMTNTNHPAGKWQDPSSSIIDQNFSIHQVAFWTVHFLQSQLYQKPFDLPAYDPAEVAVHVDIN
jgi:pimeloyl-ACP methyl ester carboxylesterase